MFVEPKQELGYPLEVKVSHDAHVIINEYAKYTKYDLDILLDKIILNLINDENFIKYAKSKRFNKKIQQVLEKHDIESNKDFIEVDDETPFDKD